MRKEVMNPAFEAGQGVHFSIRVSPVAGCEMFFRKAISHEPFRKRHRSVPVSFVIRLRLFPMANG